MTYKSDHPKYAFPEIRDALLDASQPFPTLMIYFFSDISPEDLEKLAEVWPSVDTQRRRGLLEDMESMSENDTLLFFDNVALFALDDADPVARATAIRLLWQSDEERLIPKLLNLLENDPQAIVRAAAATALGSFVYQGELEEISEESLDRIITALRTTHLSSDDRLVRRRALEALGFSSHADVPEFIQRAFNTNQEEWLQSALFAMGRSFDQRWEEPVLDSFDHPDNTVRYEAVRAAGELLLKSAREPLFDLLEEGTQDEDLYFAAIWALTKIGGDGVRQLIENEIDETEDADDLAFLEEALENLNFTEQVDLFSMMEIDEIDEMLGFGDFEEDDDD